MKTRELEGAALDWAVAVAVGPDVHWAKPGRTGADIGVWREGLAYSTDWSQGGPLIEQHAIELHTNTGGQHGEDERWYAVVPTSASGSRGAMGATPLVAAMRALVFARLGEEIEVPEL